MGLLDLVTGHTGTDGAASLDLPRTVTEARLTPRWVVWYLSMPVLAVAIVVLVYWQRSAISGLGIPVLPLYGLAVLPLLALGVIEAKRRYQRYIFKDGMIQVRTGLIDVEHENVPYRRISNVASFNTLPERILGVDNLQLNLQGTDDEIMVRGLRHPGMFEELIMQGAQEPDRTAQEEQDTGAATGQEETGNVVSDREQKANAVRKQMTEIDRQYNEGQLSKQEYQQDYWYYRGQLDLLESDEDE